MSGTTSYLKHKIRHCKDPLKKKNLQKTLDYILNLEEREKPMKPIENHYEAYGEEPYVKVCCPKCNRYQMYSSYKYCPNCGQKLDWSDK